MKKVVIYARVSTKDQETENQLCQLREYAAKQGWDVLEEIVDVGSGSKGRAERQGLERLFTLAHQRRMPSSFGLLWPEAQVSPRALPAVILCNHERVRVFEQVHYGSVRVIQGIELAGLGLDAPLAHECRAGCPRPPENETRLAEGVPAPLHPMACPESCNPNRLFGERMRRLLWRWNFMLGSSVAVTS